MSAYPEHFPLFDHDRSIDFAIGVEVGYHVSGSSTSPAYFATGFVVGYDAKAGRLFVEHFDRYLGANRIAWFENGTDQVLPVSEIPADLVRS